MYPIHMTIESWRINRNMEEVVNTVPAIIKTFLETYDFSGKTIVPFATSGGSGLGKTAETLQEIVPSATVTGGRLLNGKRNATELKEWADSFEK